MTLGLGTAAGSIGQVVFSPLALLFIEANGWSHALASLAIFVLFLIPLAFVLPATNTSADRVVVEQTIGEALSEAFSHRGYLFHVAFITVHFPPYVASLGLPTSVGAYAIALIGLFNILGSIGSGFIGQRFSKKKGLSAIYLLRAITIAALLFAPKTETTLLLFAGTMGILWLSTVPLTTGIIAQVFGVQYMATLFGIVFLSHQIGSFMGIWLGGIIFESTGSYDGMWWLAIFFGIAAAIVHWPIDERPLERLSPAAG